VVHLQSLFEVEAESVHSRCGLLPCCIVRPERPSC
jgi:hypothetical protein